MNILRKYTLRQLVLPFVVCFFLFTFIFLAGNLVKLADLLVNKGVGLFDVLRILLFFIPKLLDFTIPTSALTAILLVFGSLSQHNEVTAVRASGVNIFHIMLPVLIICFVLSIFVLILNDQFLPRIQWQYRKAKADLFMKNPSAYIEAGKFVKEFDDYTILTQKIEGTHMEGITIYQHREGKPTRTIIAERGDIISSLDEQEITLKLYDGTSDEPNPDDPNSFYKLDFDVFVMPSFQLGLGAEATAKRKVKDMTLDELIVRLREVKARRPKNDIRRKEMHELRSVMHKKVSFSFASFLFALVGLPLAIIVRRGEAVISFALAMAVVGVYYGLFVFATALGKTGAIPPQVSLYLPNVPMLLIGGFLFYRVVRV